MRVPRGSLAVLTLIEEEPRLLTFPEIDAVLHRPFADGNGLRDRAVQEIDTLFQPLERPHAGVVASKNAGG
jgi:hypothetical protein